MVGVMNFLWTCLNKLNTLKILALTRHLILVNLSISKAVHRSLTVKLIFPSAQSLVSACDVCKKNLLLMVFRQFCLWVAQSVDWRGYDFSSRTLAGVTILGSVVLEGA